MNVDSLRDVFHEQMKDVYDAEQQLTKALLKMADAASSPDLQDAFWHHLQVTRTHLERMETLLDQQGVNPGGKTCKAMRGLIEEGSEMMRASGDNNAVDAGLIAAVQKIEHYEIATYGTLHSWANTLGEAECARVFEEILAEEREADNTLTSIAEGHLNPEAA